MTMLPTYFPSPPQGVWHLGPLPIRAYALFIITGIVVALLIGDRRWEARGGQRGVIYDIALWAVPFGLVGGRLYHLATDWRTYWGPGGAGFGAALRIWDGGLGIWGAVALGGVGAWIGCRRRGIPLPAFGDAIAPGIILAQAIGRLGNYFNQELYGRETTLPWGLEIFYRRDPAGYIDPHSLDGVSTGHVFLVVQPTFLYELIWNVLVFAALIYLDRRFALGHGRLFALYVAGYCIGRFGVELLRDDTATHIAGIRINSFTSTFVFIGAVVYLMVAPKGREAPESLRGTDYVAEEAPEPEPASAPADEPATVTAAAATTPGASVSAGDDEPADSAETATAAEVADAEEPETAKAAAAEVQALEAPEEEPSEPQAEAAEEAEEAEETEEAAEPEAEESEATAEPGVAEAEEPEAERPRLQRLKNLSKQRLNRLWSRRLEQAEEPAADEAAEPGAEEPQETVEPGAEEAQEAAAPEAEEAVEPAAEEAAEPGAEEAEEAVEPEAEEPEEAAAPEAEERPEPERQESAEPEAEEAEEAVEPEAEEPEEAAEPEAEETPEPEHQESAEPEAEQTAEPEATESEATEPEPDEPAASADIESTKSPEETSTGTGDSATRRRWRLRLRNRQ